MGSSFRKEGREMVGNWRLIENRISGFIMRVRYYYKVVGIIRYRHENARKSYALAITKYRIRCLNASRSRLVSRFERKYFQYRFDVLDHQYTRWEVEKRLGKYTYGRIYSPICIEKKFEKWNLSSLGKFFLDFNNQRVRRFDRHDYITLETLPILLV